MEDARAQEIRERAITAYGGRERWLGAGEVGARLTATGLLFRMAGSRGIHGANVTAKVREQWCRLEPFEGAGTVAMLDGGRSWLEVAGAREEWDGRRRGLRSWTKTDLGRFCTYAAWNYLTFPALLLRNDIAWRARGPRTLEAAFPDTLVTHSKVQRFVLAESGLLERHEYTADMAGSWAKGVNRAISHGRAGEIPFVATRRVTPRLGPLRPPGPTLVRVEVGDFELRVR